MIIRPQRQADKIKPGKSKGPIVPVIVFVLSILIAGGFILLWDKATSAETSSAVVTIQAPAAPLEQMKQPTPAPTDPKLENRENQSIADDVEFQREAPGKLIKQSDELTKEYEDSLNSGVTNGLALPPDRVRKLEQEGRMIF